VRLPNESEAGSPVITCGPATSTLSPAWGTPAGDQLSGSPQARPSQPGAAQPPVHTRAVVA